MCGSFDNDSNRMTTKISKVKYVDLGKEYLESKDEINAAFERVMSAGSFIMRDDVSSFEQNICRQLKVAHTIGVNSGTDALFYSLAALGLSKGDEVLTVAHTFVATIAAIKHVGATPVLIDIGDDFNIDPTKIEEQITEKTKVLLPVHMNGRTCDMDQILHLGDKYGITIIEDAAQAFGAKFKGRYAGTFGAAGCFSAHPMKILSCPGDGGYITTDDSSLEAHIRLLRNHGQKSKSELVQYGFSSRLDNLHAAILNVKLQTVDDKINRRRVIADRYNRLLSDLPIKLPPSPTYQDHYDVYNSYVIRVSSSHLSSFGIEVFSHMAIPLYKNTALQLNGSNLMKNEEISNEILSLPICPQLADSEIDYVVSKVRSFFSRPR
jgi:dTDP-4-amino-4,6-dideoxygalactose transaminase